MAAEHACPICAEAGLISTVKRAELPAMQNYIYRRLELAQTAKSGQFDLVVCPACGFAHNISFDPTLVDYDEGYDNSVPSSIMTTYYAEIAGYLHGQYSLDGGLVIDIGCGKGTFLQILCEAYPKVRGLGIDPSCEADAERDGPGNVAFVQDVFSPTHIKERPSLVVCRHVLEHMFRPADFLRSIHCAFNGFPAVPFFFEAPDLAWIAQNGAFWDFCYEHCNYFTRDSLSTALRLSGFSPHTVRMAYGDQYMWVEAGNAQGLPGSHSNTRRAGSSEIPGMLARYCQNEARLIAAARQRFLRLKTEGWSTAIWGMATKGVVFSFLVDPDRTLVDFCVDVNENKHGCFVPLTGHRIEPPEALSKASPKPLAISVMNPRYLPEIKGKCKGLSLEPMFVDANGSRL